MISLKSKLNPYLLFRITSDFETITDMVTENLELYILLQEKKILIFMLF